MKALSEEIYSKSTICDFLLMVNSNRGRTTYGLRIIFVCTGVQRYCGHGLIFRVHVHDVVGHVTIGLAMCNFLLVVNMNRPCTSHGCWDTELQRFWGNDLDLFWGHVTSTVMWPLDSWYAVSYKWSFETIVLSRILVDVTKVTIPPKFHPTYK